VFIVQDDEDCVDDDKVPGEEEIYEFEDYGDDEEMLLEDTDDKSNVMKSVSKRGGHNKGAQTGSQAHMCSFCNYSTNKRYLLARHMKV
jgi:hypothetical protein